jgi:predicted nucleic-acid-binding Zn-ribbon protein
LPCCKCASTGALADIRWAIKRWVSTASVLMFAVQRSNYHAVQGDRCGASEGVNASFSDA